MADYQGKIMARAPFYITATGVQYITSATLEVYVWDGDNGTRPTNPVYTIAKDALTTTSTEITFEISNLIRDFFKHSGKAYSQNNDEFVSALWVETVLSVDQTTDPDAADINNLYVAFDGYAEHKDGINFPGTNVVLNTMEVVDGEKVQLPVYVNSDGADRVELYSDTTLKQAYDLVAQEASLLSYDKIFYVNYTNDSQPVNVIRIYKDLAVIETVLVSYASACKYPVKQIRFINKNGLLHSFYAVAKSESSFSSRSEEYKKNVGSIQSSSYQYDTSEHVYTSYLVNGRESTLINTGFVSEDKNELFRQLIFSERIWIDDVPVNLKNRSLREKTVANNKLINYAFNFENAHDFVNNV